MSRKLLAGAPVAVTVLGSTSVAHAADDTQNPTPGSYADPETPDTADDPGGGLLVDGLSR